MYCETVEFHHEQNDAVLFAGVWTYRTRDVVSIGDNTWVVTHCKSYGYLDREFGFDYSLDAKSRTVMAFSIITLVISSLALFFGWLILFIMGTPSVPIWRSIGNVFLLSCIMQGLTLLIQSSSLCSDNPVLQYMEEVAPNVRDGFSDDCEKGAGYRLGVTSTFFWGLSGIAYYAIVPSQTFSSSSSEPPQTHVVTYQQNPDGTIVESNVEIVKGHGVPEQPKDETIEHA